MNEHDKGPLPSDEIDLIDLMRTIWDLRAYVIGGALIGVVVALAVVPLVIPTRYVATVNVRVDMASLPALAAPEEVIKKLNEELGTERSDRLFSESFLAVFPEFSAFRDSDGLIFGGRFAASAKDLPISIANRVGSNVYGVTVALPGKPRTQGNMRLAVTRALNTLIIDANKDEETLHHSVTRSALDRARAVNASTSAALRQSQEGLGELVDTTSKIQSTAFKLESKTASLSAAARAFLNGAAQKSSTIDKLDQLSQTERSADSILYEQSNERLSRSLTILGLLSEEQKLSAAESQSLRTNLINLQSQLDAAYSERATFQRLIDSSAANLSEALRLSSQPIDRSKSFLPLFAAPTPPAGTSAAPGDAAEDRSHNVPVSAKPSRTLKTALGLLLGSVLGLMLGFAIKVLPASFRARQAARAAAV